MSGEPALIRVLRETLEEQLPATMASSTLFEALSAWGPRIPTNFTEILGLLDGPLRASLYAKIGEPRGRELIRGLERRLALAEKPTGKVAPHPFEEPTTRNVPRLAHAVAFQVAAGSRTLATLITSTLGPHRVRDVGGSEEPIIALIIDGTDVPRGGYGAITRATKRAMMVLFFGAEQHAARALRAHLDRASVQYAEFGAEYGIEPILDLLRSRSTQ